MPPSMGLEWRESSNVSAVQSKDRRPAESGCATWQAAVYTAERLQRAVQEWTAAGASNAPPELVCPLSLELMADPVLVASGHTYERAFILRWFREGPAAWTCPKTNSPLASREVRPNLAMRAAVRDWCRACGKPLPDCGAAMAEAERKGEAGAPSRASRVGAAELLTRGNSLSEGRSRGRSAELRELMKRSLSDRRGMGGEGEAMADAASGEEGGVSPSNVPVLPYRRASSFALSEVAKKQVLDAKAGGRGGEGGGAQQQVVDEAAIRQFLEIAMDASMSLQEEDASVEARRDESGASTSGSEGRERRRYSVEKHREAVEALWNMTKVSKATRKKMTEFGALATVLPLLDSSDSQMQEQAVTVLLNLALETEAKLKLTSDGSLGSILKMMSHGLTEKARENATAAISSLTVLSTGRQAVREGGGIPLLVDALGSGPSLRSQRDAAIGLYNLAIDPACRNDVVEAGCVVRIMDMLEENDGCEVEGEAMALLANLAKAPAAREQMERLKAIPYLVGVLEVGSDKSQENAAACLLQLALGSEKCRDSVRREGGICPLLPLAQNGSQRGREKAALLLNLLRSTKGAC